MSTNAPKRIANIFVIFYFYINYKIWQNYYFFLQFFKINIIELKCLIGYMAQYMSGAPKGIGRNARGAKHQAVVDRTVA